MRIQTTFHLDETEVREMLSEAGLDFDSPDDETHDRHGHCSSWGLDDETVIVFYSNEDGEYSISQTDAFKKVRG